MRRDPFQHPVLAPEFQIPSTATYNGPGNLKPVKGCPKGKHRVGGKMQKKKHAKHNEEG